MPAGSVIGYCGIIVAVLGLGTNMVPLKGVEIGDGVFYQFCMCCAAFTTALPVLIIQGFPPIHGLALLGGFLWCNGNMLCPLAIKFIGLGQALILWGCMSLLFGWASGTFGLFGLHRQHISNPTLNYVGVGLCVLRLLIYLQVRTTPEKVSDDGDTTTDFESGVGLRRDGSSSLLLGLGGGKGSIGPNAVTASPLSKKALDASCEDLTGLTRTIRFMSESSHNTETPVYSYNDSHSFNSRVNSSDMLLDAVHRGSPARQTRQEESKDMNQSETLVDDGGITAYVDIENDSSEVPQPYSSERYSTSVVPSHIPTVTFAERSISHPRVQAPLPNPQRQRHQPQRHQQQRPEGVDFYAWYVHQSPAEAAAQVERENEYPRTLSFASNFTSTTVAAEIGHRLRAYSIVLIGDDWNDRQRRFAGIFLAILAGCFFGLCFDPSQYVIDNRYEGADNTLNYVFSHYLGILLTSWIYTIIYFGYHTYTKQRPFISDSCVLPATLSGLIWGMAMAGWFVANGELGFPITFPIVSAGPGFIGALWSIFVFQEITDWQNIRTLLLAMLVTVPALTLVALSH